MQALHRKHAKYAPSASSRWIVCPGSVALVESLPVSTSGPSSDYALDGTDAHSAFAFCLEWNLNAKETVASQTLFRTDDRETRTESVQLALDYVHDILSLYPDAELHIEDIVTVSPNCWGHCDVWIYAPRLNMVYVIDFKHGSGIEVDIAGNTQAKTYALGVINKLADRGIAIDYVATVIIQPRMFHPDGPIRAEVISAQELTLEFGAVINKAIARCEAPDAPLIPGKHQCRFCPATLICPAREAVALQVVNETFGSISDVIVSKLPNPKQMPAPRLGMILPALKMLEAWIDEVKEQAYFYAVNGGFIPGYKLVDARTKARWIDQSEKTVRALMALAETNNIDDVFPRKLITLTEARTLIRETIRNRHQLSAKEASFQTEEIMEILLDRTPSGKMSLAPISDPRPAIDVVKQTFTTVPQLPAPGGS